jgi:hypothetical protein
MTTPDQRAGSARLDSDNQLGSPASFKTAARAVGVGMVIAVAVAAAIAMTWGAGTGSGAPAADRTGSGWPRWVPHGVTATVATPRGSNTPSRSSAVVTADSGSQSRPTPPATPGPHLQPFASAVGPAMPPQPSPTVPVAVPRYIDGCDHDYAVTTGEGCVPVNFPPEVGPDLTDRCAFLKSYGTIKVVGVDRLGLDPNHDGVACDQGD